MTQKSYRALGVACARATTYSRVASGLPIDDLKSRFVRPHMMVNP